VNIEQLSMDALATQLKELEAGYSALAARELALDLTRGKPGVEQDAEFVKLSRDVAKSLSEKVFDGGKVEIHLCDATLTTLKAVDSSSP